MTVSGATENATAPDPISFGPMINGTYPFSVTSISTYLTAPAAGQVIVEGANFAQLVVFTCWGCGPVYQVGFNETGLASGTPWSVVVTVPWNDSEVSLAGNTPLLTTVLPAGLYNYTLATVPGYHSNASGQVDVAGNTSVKIAFVRPGFAIYAVTFTEAGLAFGSAWSITINGTFDKSSSSSVVVALGNGTYSWGITAEPAGYVASPNGGVISVEGAPASVSIIFTTHQGVTPVVQGSPVTPLVGWAIFGGMVGAAVIALGAGLAWGRRTRSRPRLLWGDPPSSIGAAAIEPPVVRPSADTPSVAAEPLEPGWVLRPGPSKPQSKIRK